MDANKEIMTTLIKGLSVIKAFDAQHTQMTLSDVAKKVDISRSSARRILLTLESLGYMFQKDSYFSLSPRIIELGYSYYASLPWADLAYENLKKVAHLCNLSCSISIIDKEHVICIMRINATRILSEGVHIGSKLPAAYTATGRVFMAHLSDDELKKYIKNLPLKAYTKKSILDPEALYKEVCSRREKGYQIVEEELEDGLVSIAVPIYMKGGELMGTMNIGAHMSYKDITYLKQQVLLLLKEAANETKKANSLLQ